MDTKAKSSHTADNVFGLGWESTPVMISMEPPGKRHWRWDGKGYIAVPEFRQSHLSSPNINAQANIRVYTLKPYVGIAGNGSVDANARKGKKKKNYVGKGNSPYNHFGKRDTLAQESLESPMLM
eukprot:856920-Pelagomonas_calceolata.AAC.2